MKDHGQRVSVYTKLLVVLVSPMGEAKAKHCQDTLKNRGDTECLSKERQIGDGEVRATQEAQAWASLAGHRVGDHSRSEVRAE